MSRRVPDIPDFAKVNFVTGYILQGCEPPYSALVEFAKEPAKDLVMILIGLDPEDILKDWLRPGRGRFRAPERHGRKRPFAQLSLDPNDYFGSQPRKLAGPYPGIDLPGSRALFHITDQLDRVAITAAVLEGVTDIGYESLLGVLTMHPEHCPTMPFVNRRSTFPQEFPGAIAENQYIGANELLNSQWFTPGGSQAYRVIDKPWYLGWSAYVVPYSIGGCIDWEPTIWSSTRGKISDGPKFTRDQNEGFHVSVGADCLPGEFCWPARRTAYGSVTLYDVQVLGFGGGLW